MSSAIKNSAYYAIGSVIKAASSFLLLPLFANILGAEQYGIFNVLQTFSAILGTLMTMATERSLYRLLYDYKTASDRIIFLSTTFWTINIISGIIFFICLCFGTYISLFIGNIYIYKVLLPVVIYTFLMSLINYTQILMQIEQKGAIYFKISLMVLVIYNITSLICLFFYSKTVESLICGNVIANLLVFPFAFYNIRKRIRFVFSFKVLHNVLRYSLPMFVMIVFSWLLSMTDRLYIANLVNFKEAGIYSLASKFMQVITLFAGAIFQAYGPYFYKTTSNFDYNTVLHKLKPINECITLMICMIAILVCSFSKVIISVFVTSVYRPCTVYIYILSLSCVFTQQSGLLNLMIYQNKKTIGLSLITVFCALLSLILNYSLIPTFGPLAAGFSNLITGISLFGLTFSLAKRNYYIPLGYKILLYTTCVIFLLFIYDSIIENLFLGVFFKTGSLFLLIYCAYKSNVISKDAYPIIGKMTKKIFSKFSFI